MSLKAVVFGITGLLWAAGIACGFTVLGRYDGTAGAPGRPPADWPTGAGLDLDPARPTLLLFAHPRCPCTPASLEQLNRLLARGGGGASITVLFYDDPALGPDWSRTDLWDTASAMQGVTVRADPLGATAQLFGARTSGQVCLYAPDGSLLFEGGLTPARGRPGDAPGFSAVHDWLLHGHGPAHAPVFGCGLVGPMEVP